MGMSHFWKPHSAYFTSLFKSSLMSASSSLQGNPCPTESFYIIPDSICVLALFLLRGRDPGRFQPWQMLFLTTTKVLRIICIIIGEFHRVFHFMSYEFEQLCPQHFVFVMICMTQRRDQADLRKVSSGGIESIPQELSHSLPTSKSW